MTLKVPVALSLPNDALAGEISMVHSATPSCRTETDCPAIVKVPVRSALSFAIKLTLTVPGPVPLVPLVMDIQPRSEAAVHVQLFAVVTVTEFGPPDAPNDNDVVDNV